MGQTALWRWARCWRWLGALAVVSTLAATSLYADEPSGYKQLELDGAKVRWSNTRARGPIVLTYALVSSPRTFTDARNCASLSPIEEALAGSHIDVEHFRVQLAAAFAMWAEVADLAFREADPSEHVDILIGAQGQPLGSAFTDVHYRLGTGSSRAIDRTLICLNPKWPWKISFDGDLAVYDLRYTLAHEIGHAIGLDHPSASGQLMSYRYDEKSRQLQAGDIAGVIAIYGPHVPAEQDRAKSASLTTGAINR